MTLVRPQALPNELDRSYLGVVMRINGFADEAASIQRIATWAGISNRKAREVSTVELLGRVAGLDTVAFVRQHTTLPLRRGITSYKTELEHGSADGKAILYASGVRLAREGAYFCVECVREDQDFHRRSYWRREHQVPGVFWCARHSTALHYRDEVDAFLAAPSRFVDDAREVGTAWARATSTCQSIARYIEICEALLNSQRPFEVRAVREVLRSQARPLGLRMYPGKGQATIEEPLLSDVFAETLPVDWLSMVVPAIREKKRGEVLPSIDGVLWNSTSASSVVPYALACGVLFASADDALNALNAAKEPAPPVDRMPSSDMSDEYLRNAYVSNAGRHVRVKSEVSNAYAASTRLQALGLPNMQLRSGRSIRAAAEAFFLAEKTLKESAELGGVSLEELETFVRHSGGALKGALSRMFNQDRREAGCTKPRVKPLTPHSLKSATERKDHHI